jgi:hypothetical protein
MQSALRFDELLEAVDKLPLEDQETLLAILERRRLARRRAELAADVREAREEFETGKATAKTPAELMQEIMS